MAPERGRDGGGRRGRGSGVGRGRGSGLSRGRSSGFGRGRGRDGTRGRGSTRSRGRGGRKSTFTSARLEQPMHQDQVEASENVPQIGEQALSDYDESSSDEEDVPADNMPAFSALLQSFAAENTTIERQSKRRKLAKDVSPQELDEDDEVLEDGMVDLDAVDDVDEADDSEEELHEEEEVPDEGPDRDEDNGSDPFDVHFANPNEDTLTRQLLAIAKNEWGARKIDHGKVGKAVISLPIPGLESWAPSGSILRPEGLHLKSKLVEPAKKLRASFDPLEATLAPYIFQNQDVLYCGRASANAGGLRTMYCLHALNHILKTRDRILKNNARLARNTTDEDLELRDQGFTRPKVLIILPTRQSCVRVVDILTSLFIPDQQENKKRFTDSFDDPTSSSSSNKPAEFIDLFAGNDDDMFRIGLKFTRRSMKFFSQFYTSDIILASPLGLRMLLGDSADESKTPCSDHDFLSSIEILILDQTDALLMQNWEHITHIFQHLNLQPKEAHGCDFSRVRNWYLDNHARHLRQTLVFSAFNTPDLNSLFTHHMQNVSGRVKITPPYDGALLRQSFPCKQTFSRFLSPTPATDPDTRFDYFRQAILPSLLRTAAIAATSNNPTSAPATVIFIPSTLDFIRLRNHLSTATTLPFASISEYTPGPDVSRARSHLITGRHHVLLYTERAHHFRRSNFRGVARLVFYGIPQNPLFWGEVLAWLGKSVQDGREDVAVKAMFGRWDGLALERIVGSQRAAGMINAVVGDTFEFV